MNALDDLISIIVPIYKVEKYLRKCVDSVLAQTYKNIEVILVDDGSPDDCGAICDEYAAKDKRVRVIHKQNEGVSVARNTALDAAGGGWFGFMDSDDVIPPDYFEYLYNLAVKYNADISCVNCVQFTVGEEPKYVHSNIEPRVMNGLRFMTECLYDRTGFWLWNKLFRRDVWGNARMPVGLPLMQDVVVGFDVLPKAKKVVFDEYTLLYGYRRHDSQVTQNPDVYHRRFFELLSYFEAEASKYARGRDPITNAFDYFIFRFSLHLITHNSPKDIPPRAWDFVKRHRLGVLRDANAKKTVRIKALLACFGKWWALRAAIKVKQLIWDKRTIE